MVNASRYTENLINHLSLDGSTHQKSICETLIKYFASNCQGLLKMLSIRLESNDSSQLKSTRHTRSRFARHLENILQVTTKWVEVVVVSTQFDSNRLKRLSKVDLSHRKSI